MLKRLILAAIFAVIAYLACVFVGGLLMTVNVPIAAALGSFLREFAGLISLLFFMYYALVGVVPTPWQ